MVYFRTWMMNLSSPFYKMIARCPSQDLEPDETNRFKYRNFSLDKFPDILFCLHPRRRSDAYFSRGRLEPPDLVGTEPQPVETDTLTWMESDQDGRRRSASGVNGVLDQTKVSFFFISFFFYFNLPLWSVLDADWISDFHFQWQHWV